MQRHSRGGAVNNKSSNGHRENVVSKLADLSLDKANEAVKNQFKLVVNSMKYGKLRKLTVSYVS